MTAHADGTDIEDLSGAADDDPPSRLQRHLPPQVRQYPSPLAPHLDRRRRRRCNLRCNRSTHRVVGSA
jgi:hypothetical protein